jgi:hypothetical protein
MSPVTLRNEDEKLAKQNRDVALDRLRTSGRLPEGEEPSLVDVLESLFWDALPYFRMRPDLNPVHHHTQVLDNMVQICLGEEAKYETLRNATIAALLHDIGNSVSKQTKIKTDEITAVTDRRDRTRQCRIKNKLQKQAVDLAHKAFAFRMEHMSKGPPLVIKLTSKLVEDGFLSEEDVVLICDVVRVHDNPTVEQLMEICRKADVETDFAEGFFLLPHDDTSFGTLTSLLREADRLYMMTDQGVRQDLSRKTASPTADEIKTKRKKNADKHRREYVLYENVGQGDGFIGNTLYRTETGFRIFQKWILKD